MNCLKQNHVLFLHAEKKRLAVIPRKNKGTATYNVIAALIAISKKSDINGMKNIFSPAMYYMQ
jgi:hypothetical protein